VVAATQTVTAPARPKADAKAAVQPAAPPSRPVFIQPKDKMEERLRRIEEDMQKPRPRQPASGLDDKHAPIYE
jgi:hypothetical protein